VASLLPLAAAEPGFSFGGSWAIGLVFAGIAVFAAVGALSHEHERAFSASTIYLALGLLAAAVIQLLDVRWLQPVDDHEIVEHLAEIAVVIALFGTGLRIDRALRWREWTGVTRLLVLAMPLTIAGIALFGMAAMGLSLGAAIVLGSILAPTDPVLAGDLGVGPPGDEVGESESDVGLTGEAGFNDGLAFPFLLLGVLVAGDDAGWLAEWVAADVVYAILGGALIGALVGYGVAASYRRLRDRELLSHDLDGWAAIGGVFLIYGLAEVAGTYGFIAAFAGGLAFRRYEHGHDYNRRVHQGAELVTKFGELALVLLVGSMVTVDGLGLPGAGGWLLIPVLFLVIRPASVMVSLVRSRLSLRERAFVGWFGVRGIGSLYYLAVAVATGAVAGHELEVISWTTILCIIASIFVHGLSASPLERRLLR
jgi:NhaP-type Na+/H+ or K+/H+ antiporter